MLRFICTCFVLFGLMPALVSPVFGADEDDVLSIIDEAATQYKNGDYAGAASNLDYASQLIRQKKSEAMKVVLPEPLAGWEAEDATAQSLGTAVFGGGTTVSRTYRRKPSQINIDIVTDSPVLQSLVMMINNPMVAGASGGKLQTIKGQRAIVQYNEETGSGDVNIVVDNRFMVTVKGEKVEKEELLAYAEAIDFEGLLNK